jgi:hypothetical protein
MFDEELNWKYFGRVLLIYVGTALGAALVFIMGAWVYSLFL